MIHKILIILGMITVSGSLFAMFPAQPQAVQVVANNDSKDLMVKHELQGLEQDTSSAIEKLYKGRAFGNEPMKMIARQELREQKKLCVDLKKSQVHKQKARYAAVKQIACINNVLAGVYRNPAIRKNLVAYL